MKKLITIFLISLICLTSLCLFSCGTSDGDNSKTPPPSTPVETAVYIDGLKFDLLEDGNYYLVTVGQNASNNIVIPDTCNGKAVTEIGLNAFYACKSVVSLTIPNTIESIGSNAFKNCSNLKSVIFSDNSKLIKLDAVFNGCSSLEDIDFGKNSALDVIEAQAFIGCSRIKNLVLPERLTKIGTKAFYGCSGIESIKLPASLTTIETWAFENCSALKSITIASGNTAFAVSDNVLFSKNMKTIIKYPSANSTTSYSIPASVTTISDSAFSGAKNLKTVNLSSATSLTSICNSAFKNCSQLTQITIPASLTVLEDSAFQDCYLLSSIKFENGSKLKTIGKFAFSDCTALTQLDFGNTENLKVIGQDAFHFCENLKTVTIPESVERIEGFAFEYCGLQSLHFGENSKLNYIGTNAFTYCESLNNVVIPVSVAKIDLYAFDFCFSLTNFGYKGTISQWSKVTKGAVWRDRAPFTYVQCSDGNV